MRGAALGALLLLLQPPIGHALQQRESAGAVIEGVVVRADTGEPIPRARVTVESETAGSTGTTSGQPAGDRGRDAAQSATTDDRGRFVFSGLTAGSYRIVAARNGFVRQRYGQRFFGGPGTAVTITSDDARREIAFRLVPTGSVSGAVRDVSGEPLPGFQVQLLRAVYNSAGQRTLRSEGGDRTDDRGEYRVYGVTPGRYYVAASAGASGQGLARLGGLGSPNEVTETSYPTTYYPGVSDVSAASGIDVFAGTDLNAVDFLVGDVAVVHVRGRLVDSLTGQPPRSASVSIVRRGPAAASGQSPPGSGQIYNPADGTFDLSGIPSGSYWVRANVAANSNDAVVPAGAAGRAFDDVFIDALFSQRQVGQAAVEVFDADIEGLELVLGAGVSIRGRARVERQDGGRVPDLTRLQVALRPAVPGMLVNPGSRQPIGRDGTFVLTHVLPGDYQVAVHGLPADAFIKEARLGQDDVLDQPARITGGDAGAMTVVLSGAAGRVDGVIVDAERRGVPAAETVLVPLGRTDRVDLYRSASSDESGRFSIRGVPPGEYRVFAWEDVEPFGYFDPDFLRRFEQRGQTVRIGERERVDLEVRLIPATGR
jgi:protocatechuate 3,4-dioxygenase beta subunit